MGDDHSIRCVTCCTAATGGDPLRIDPDLWKPFIGGIESSNRVRVYEAQEAVRLAPFLKPICASILGLLNMLEAEADAGGGGAFVDLELDVTMNMQNAVLDRSFFVDHGDHKLVVSIGNWMDNDACSECWWPKGAGGELGVVRPRGHDGPHGRPPP